MPLCKGLLKPIELDSASAGEPADILESFKLQMISPFFMNSIILMDGQFGLLGMISFSKGCNQVFSLV